MSMAGIVQEMNDEDLMEKFYAENRTSLLKKIKGRGVREVSSEDVLHESCARALKYMHTYDARLPFAGWFNTIMNNAIKDHKRDERAQGITRDTRDVDDAEEGQEFNILLADQLEREIEGRPELHRHVLYLYFIKNVPRRDITQLVEVNYENLSYIIKSFKADMKEKYDEAA